MKKYSVAIVYTKDIAIDTIDIYLKLAIVQAQSEETALSLVKETLKGSMKDFKVNNTVVLEIE
jgi:hypothetical protein